LNNLLDDPVRAHKALEKFRLNAEREGKGETKERSEVEGREKRREEVVFKKATKLWKVGKHTGG